MPNQNNQRAQQVKYSHLEDGGTYLGFYYTTEGVSDPVQMRRDLLTKAVAMVDRYGEEQKQAGKSFLGSLSRRLEICGQLGACELKPGNNDSNQ